MGERARTRSLVATCLLMVATAVTMATIPASGASSSVVVTMDVASATSISVAGCPGGATNQTAFGSVLPGTSYATTVDCAITFDSSNDMATLRVHQTDGDGAPMFQPSAGPTDTGWGTGGQGYMPGAVNENPTNVAIQDDGRPVLVGSSAAGTIVVARFTLAGGPDGSFGTGGLVTLDPSVGSDVGGDVEIDANGKILVSGTKDFFGSRTMVVFRLEANGDVDGSFGTAGMAEVDIPGGQDRNYAMELMADGRIVLGGDVCCYRFAAARLTANGVLDDTFSGNGMVDLDIPEVTADTAHGLDVAPDGSVVLTGDGMSGSWRPVVARFTPAGAPDLSFSGDGGWADLTVSNGINADPTILPDGRILVPAQDSTFRLLANGSGDDPTFNGGARHAFAGVTNAAIDSLGNTLLVSNTTVYRLRPDGSLDTTFNGTGSRSLGLASTTLRAIDETSDGRVLVATSQTVAAVQHMSTTRLTSTAISGYQAGVHDWSTGAGSMFGACLNSIAGANAASDWVPGACGTSNGAWWNGVPAATPGAAIAHTTLTGASATANLRFGVRTAASQRPGAYVAPLTFEVVAP